MDLTRRQAIRAAASAALWAALPGEAKAASSAPPRSTTTFLRPLMAPYSPNAPPELAAALDTFDQLAADHIASARVPTAA